MMHVTVSLLFRNVLLQKAKMNVMNAMNRFFLTQDLFEFWENETKMYRQYWPSRLKLVLLYTQTSFLVDWASTITVELMIAKSATIKAFIFALAHIWIVVFTKPFRKQN